MITTEAANYIDGLEMGAKRQCLSLMRELYQDACDIIDSAQHYAYHAVNETLVKRNWLLGLRIQ